MNPIVPITRCRSVSSMGNPASSTTWWSVKPLVHRTARPAPTVWPRAWSIASPDQRVSEMHLDMVAAEHAHMPGEPLHPDAGAGLGREQVQELVSRVERALGVDRGRFAEFAGDVEQRPFEICRQLARVPTG